MCSGRTDRYRVVWTRYTAIYTAVYTAVYTSVYTSVCTVIYRGIHRGTHASDMRHGNYEIIVWLSRPEISDCLYHKSSRFCRIATRFGYTYSMSQKITPLRLFRKLSDNLRCKFFDSDCRCRKLLDNKVFLARETCRLFVNYIRLLQRSITYQTTA